MGEQKFLLGPYFVLGQWDYTKEGSLLSTHENLSHQSGD